MTDLDGSATGLDGSATGLDRSPTDLDGPMVGLATGLDRSPTDLDGPPNMLYGLAAGVERGINLPGSST